MALLLLLNLAVEFLIRNFQENWEELELDGTHRPVCASDVIYWTR
jgi:hypothetical protein